jgi:hypothetical protein
LTETTDLIVFWLVVLSRFLIPLAIPRFPLPAILAALVLDAVDQTIFQQFTNLNLDGYQGYDKALDIYYLTVAYISTLRNWSSLFAFKMGRFLWYYRLLGVVLFEFIGNRALLFIFPNTFEYFFIFYEIVRLRWDPRRMSKKAVIIATAAIWIFIKLPQEYWIHIAQLDMTDFLKETVFGVSTDAGLSEILEANIWLIPALIIIAVVIVVGGRWLLRKLPPKDWALSFDADSHEDEESGYVETETVEPVSGRFFDKVLVEKVVLVSMVSLIFGKILPNRTGNDLQLVVGVTFIIILNTVISHWLARRGREMHHILSQFVVMAVVNFGLALLYVWLLPSFDGLVNTGNVLFFVLLLTLIINLFDMYHPVYQARFAEKTAPAEIAGEAAAQT